MMRGAARFVNKVLRKPLKREKPKRPQVQRLMPTIPEAERAIISRFRPYTLVDEGRSYNLIRAVRYVDQNEVGGDIVECGVWKGGSAMLAKVVSARPRMFHLFDTFSGMTSPTAEDVRYDGSRAEDKYKKRKREDHTDWAYSSLEETKSNFSKEGLLDSTLVWHVGPVESTLLDTASLPESISILRLDTDWYQSTLLELEILYPRLVPGGILIIDDYDHWTGARKAVDEYFGTRQPFFCAMTGGGAITVKPA